MARPYATTAVRLDREAEAVAFRADPAPTLRGLARQAPRLAPGRTRFGFRGRPGSAHRWPRSQDRVAPATQSVFRSRNRVGRATDTQLSLIPV